jgi:hypothetical protein
VVRRAQANSVFGGSGPFPRRRSEKGKGGRRSTRNWEARQARARGAGPSGSELVSDRRRLVSKRTGWFSRYSIQKGNCDVPPTDQLTRLSVIGKLAILDLIAGLFLTWLLIDDPRRAPFLYFAIPALVCANFAVAWWKFRNRASITLPAVYLFGFVFGIVWTIEAFKWWKLPLLLVPLAFFIINVQRFRKALAAEG